MKLTWACRSRPSTDRAQRPTSGEVGKRILIAAGNINPLWRGVIER